MAKKILVTGSSGFVGTHFIRSSSGWDIKEVDLLREDVSRIDFTDCQSVLHLAALVHQMKKIPDAEFFKVNRDLSFAVAQRAKLHGVKQFILMSTVKVYGESSGDMTSLDENSVCNPEDAYGKSKLEAENLIRSIETDLFRVAVIRSPMVYGPGVKANMLNLFRLISILPILPFAGIENRRSIVYIENLIALICKIIENEASGVFIAGDPEPLSTSALITLMAKSLDKHNRIVTMPKIVLNTLRRLKPSISKRLLDSFELDNTLTNHKLGFTTPFSTEEGIRKTTEWFVKMK